ncbi:MAG: ABC transporter permease [Methanolinea sp.]|jgi:putative ABC transport system permease protein|nr:ABC transporter permease [Methanolinea sp.]
MKDIILQLALRSIRIHFLRSVLAALGIVIGVVAISSMGMMGANMTLSVTEELSRMANIVVITAASGSERGPGGFGGGSDEKISEEDFQDIQKIAEKYGLVYVVYRESDRIKVGDREGWSTIYGLDEDVMRRIFTLSDGAFPKSTSSVIVGPTLAGRYDLKVGSRIRIGDEDKGATTTVKVVGILEERGMSNDINSDMAIIGSEKLFTGIYGNEGEYNQVNLILNDINDSQKARTEILEKMNRKKTRVNVQDSSRMLESITSTLGTMTTFVMAIAGISLLVAATSIFNVMMMSVTERVREIGIMRSIGAQKSEIRRMFLYESVVLGVVGAGIGAVLALGIGWVVVLAMVGSTDYFFLPESLVYIPFAMLVGIAVCILSGVYPAWRAADLDPVEALRAE